MRTRDVWINSVGVRVPEPMPVQEAVDRGWYDAESRDWHGWTGAAVAGDVPAPDLAADAARQALDRWDGQLADVVLHLHAGGYAQGPVGWSPQHYVLRSLGDSAAPSISVWQSCNGMLAALELGAAYLTATPSPAAALVTGADNLGVPGFNRWALGLQYGVLGDAGSALVLSGRPGFARLLAVGSASVPEAEQVTRGSRPIFPPDREVDAATELARRVGEHVGDGAEFAARLAELRTEMVLRTLAEADLRPGEVTRVAHTFIGHERYLKTVLAPLGLHTGQGLLEFGRRVGHLTVNDQAVGLAHLVADGQLGVGDHVLLLGFTAGVSAACAVVRIERIPAWGRRR